MARAFDHLLKPTLVAEARRRIDPFVSHTPVATSRTLDQQLGAEVFFKCEHLQQTGAFKFRGASHALSWFTDEQRTQGVVTHSSGNHGQAVALAAKIQGSSAYIVMPENAPEVKQRAVLSYGAKVIHCRATLADREETARQVQQETGATLVHPYNDAFVITGQGTAAAELMDDVPNLDIVLAPIGGGGLISGTCLATSARTDAAPEVWGAEPAGADDAARSKAGGFCLPQENPQTIADGLRAGLGSLTWPFVRDQVTRIVTVEDEEIIQAMRWVWERMKMIIEPSAAVAVASLLKAGEAKLAGKRIGVILTGGNVDLDHLPWQSRPS